MAICAITKGKILSKRRRNAEWLKLQQESVTVQSINSTLSSKPYGKAACCVSFLILGTLTSLWLGCQTRIPREAATATALDAAEEPVMERATRGGGTNALALVEAGRTLPTTQREGWAFLLEHMPPHDLEQLPAALMLENIALAYAAMEKAPWRERVPKEIFLNDILPYACVNETRDTWRKHLYEKCAPLVADCQTPAEAAQRLNQKLFKLLNVRYSTGRKKADQSPQESMESGLASCTGLSILLVDACRAVGVPARLVGTPLWTNLRGNHTWVEIWDGGWHFTGAAEPDPKGLDRGWFAHDASQARPDSPEHSIYASSFKKTGLSFPLVWAREVDWVNAENVTARYAKKADGNLPSALVPTTNAAKSSPVSAPVTNATLRLLVKVMDRAGGRRVAARVTVAATSNAPVKLEGTSRDENADLNDLLVFEVVRGRRYAVQAELGERKVSREWLAATNAEEVVVLCLQGTHAYTLPAHVAYVPPRVVRSLPAADEAKLRKALSEYFAAAPKQQATWKFPGNLDRMLKANEPAVRHAVWKVLCSAPLYEELKSDFDTQRVRFDKYVSPYTVKMVGSRPTNGWALFIAMHGGGGAPPEVNDSQWKHMQVYYRDHPEAGGYLYLALRAPNNSWNGFYDTYVYPLIANLTRQFRVLGDVDPNKIFLMGYSHGGYGAFAIGPKMPDQFAAIHASAAAPTDGETTPRTLRNTLFTSMVGEKDTMYGRYERNKKFAEAIAILRGERSDIYPVRVDIIAGNGHTGLPDRDNIQGMYPAVRNPVPRELTWAMTDKVIKDFFWLKSETPGKHREISAVCRDNRITVTTTTNVVSAALLLDHRLIDYKKSVTLEVNGQRSRHMLQPSLRVLCETMRRRGDPELAFTVELSLPLEPLPSVPKLQADQPGTVQPRRAVLVNISEEMSRGQTAKR